MYSSIVDTTPFSNQKFRRLFIIDGHSCTITGYVFSNLNE